MRPSAKAADIKKTDMITARGHALALVASCRSKEIMASVFEVGSYPLFLCQVVICYLRINLSEPGSILASPYRSRLR